MSISNKPFLASTIIRTSSICTVRIRVAVVVANAAFINIYNDNGYISHNPSA